MPRQEGRPNAAPCLQPGAACLLSASAGPYAPRRSVSNLGGAASPWDNKPRIDGLLSRLFGAADDDLSRWASRYIGLGALQRSYQPGSKLDETPVLIGDQDVGKSAFTKAWFDAEHIHWHGEGADLAAKGKEQAEALDGRVIVELSELDGVKKADITKLKAFLTRTDDGSFRRAYAMFTQPNRAGASL